MTNYRPDFQVHFILSFDFVPLFFSHNLSVSAKFSSFTNWTPLLQKCQCIGFRTLPSIWECWLCIFTYMHDIHNMNNMHNTHNMHNMQIICIIRILCTIYEDLQKCQSDFQPILISPLHLRMNIQTARIYFNNISFSIFKKKLFKVFLLWYILKLSLKRRCHAACSSV